MEKVTEQRLQRAIHRLEVVAEHLEAMLGSRAAPPEDDPEAIAMAKKYVSARRWQLLRDAGVELGQDEEATAS